MRSECCCSTSSYGNYTPHLEQACTPPPAALAFFHFLNYGCDPYMCFFQNNQLMARTIEQGQQIKKTIQMFSIILFVFYLIRLLRLWRPIGWKQEDWDTDAEFDLRTSNGMNHPGIRQFLRCLLPKRGLTSHKTALSPFLFHVNLTAKLAHTGGGDCSPTTPSMKSMIGQTASWLLRRGEWQKEKRKELHQRFLQRFPPPHKITQPSWPVPSNRKSRRRS